jgi:hypothetical protein
MNEFEATAAIGDCVRGLHGFTKTPEQAAAMLRPAMNDAVNTGLIHARITTAIRTNQDAIVQAQNRIADLIKLRTLIASRGEATNPTDAPRPVLMAPVPGHTPAGPAADGDADGDVCCAKMGHHEDPRPHLCRLPKNHEGPHKCSICGTIFDNGQPLP